MKYLYIYIVILFIHFVSPCLASYNDEVIEGYDGILSLFEERNKDTQKELRAYLARYPYTPYEDECYTMLGILKIERNNYTQGIKDLDRVLPKYLDDKMHSLYLFYYGYAYVMVERYDKAIAFFEPLTKQTSEYNDRSDFYLAYCYYRQGEYDKCIPQFQKIENREDYKSTVPYYIVQIYYQEGKNEEVITKGELILKNQPDNSNNIDIHRILGEVYYNAGKYDNALFHLNEYAKLCKKQKSKPISWDIYLLGKLFYDKGNYEAGIEYFKQVSETKDSVSAYSRFMLGNAYNKLGQKEKAKLSYFSVAELGLSIPIEEEAMYNYVLCAFQNSSSLGESINAFKDFLKRYPKSRYVEKIYPLFSDALMHSKNYALALQSLDSLDIKDKKVDGIKQYLRYQLGTEAFVNGRYTDAERWLTEVIVQSKQHQSDEIVNDAYNWRAETRYRLHKYVACQVDIEKYLSFQKNKKGENFRHARYLYAYSLFMNKEYKKAKRSFELYVNGIERSDPAYADAFNRMGDCELYERNFSSAIANYKEVIKLHSVGSDYALYQCGYVQGLLRHYDKKEQMMRELQEGYPKSDYADDALYELARALIEQQEEQEAINTYQRLIKVYPKSPYLRRASLETAMLLRNIGQNDEAIKWYKQTIERYPRTEEAYSALNDLESMYVENNKIKDYLAYTKQIQKLNMKVTTANDSLTYVTAELQYMLNKYSSAIPAFENYLSSFCPGGRYCVVAMYYLADCFYKQKDTTNAIKEFVELTKIDGNQYMEEACLRIAELAYEKKDYSTALQYFYKLQNVVSNTQNTSIAYTGILRCCFYLNKFEEMINIATVILNDEFISEDIKEEARYNRAKAYVSFKDYKKALSDIQSSKRNVKTTNGAELEYLLALCLFETQKPEEAEEAIMNFTQKNTPHMYWLAKSLILLSDIYVQKGDIFQAQQYLISLQSNYKQNDDIQSIILDKLEHIENLQRSEDSNIQK